MKKLIIAGLLSSTFLVSSAPMAHAGLEIGAALSAFFVNAGASIAAATALSSATMFILKAVGVSLLSSLLKKSKKPEASQGIKTATTTGGSSPQTFVMGRYATGGQLVAPLMSYGKSAGTPNAYLVYVVAYSGLPQKLLRIMVNDEYVSWGSSMETFGDGDQGYPLGGIYEGKGWIRIHDGTQTAADQLLLTRFGGDPDRPWTSGMIGKQISYAVVIFKYDPEVLNSPPRLRFEVEGIKLYDPRKDSTVGGSGSHRWGQTSTYETTTNGLVMAYNIHRGIMMPDGSRWGGVAEAGDLPLASWFGAMNEADLLVDDGKGGSEKQYETGLEVSVDQKPTAILEQIELANAMQHAEIGGKWKVRVGPVGLPILAITDEDILVSHSRKGGQFPSVQQTKNGITALFPNPDALWANTESAPRRNSAWEAQDGERLTAAFNFSSVFKDSQVQRLMDSLLADHRRFRNETLTLGPYASMLEPLDAVSWISDEEHYSSKVFEVEQVEEDPLTLNVVVVLKERDSADFTPPAGYLLPTVTPVNGSRIPQPQSVPGFNVAALELKDADGVARRPAIQCTWNGADLYDVRGIKLQYRIQGTLAPIYDGYAANVAGGVALLTDVIPNEDYEVQANLDVDRPTAWTAWKTVKTPNVQIRMEDLAEEIEDNFREIAERAGLITVESLPATGEPNQIIFDLTTKTLYRWDAEADPPGWTDNIYAGIKPESVGINELAASIVPPINWTEATLPATKQASAVLMWNGKLYRWDGTKYTANVDTEDLDLRVGGSNLLYNSGLLNVTPVGWTVSGSSTGVTLTYDAAGRGFGRWAIVNLTSTASSGTFGLQTANVSGQGVLGGWQANSEYVVSVYAKGTGNVVGRTLGLALPDAAGAVVTPLNNPAIAATEQRHSFRVQTVGTVSGGRLDFRINRSGLAVSNKLYLTNPQVEEGNTLTSYAPRAGEILPGTIGADQLAPDAVTADKIAAGAINAAKFATGLEPVNISTAAALPTTKLGELLIWQGDAYRWNGTAYTKGVATADLVGSIQNSQIAAVAASKITGQLTDSQIAAVAAAKMTGTITETQIASNAITTPKIAAGAVQAAKIDSGAVTSEKIFAEAVTAAKIGVGAVTAAKIDAGAVTTAKLDAGAVVADKIATNAVTSEAILAGAITSAKVQAGAIRSTELASNAVTATKLAVTNFTNLITNSELEIADGWSLEADVQILNGSSRPTGSSQPGVFEFPPSGTIRYANWTPGSYVQVKPGEQYLVGASFRASGSGDRQFTGRVRVTYYNADRTTVIDNSARNIVTKTTTSYTEESSVYVVPDEAAWARFSFGRAGDVAGELQTGYIEAPFVRRMNEGQLIVDGAITSNKVEALAITTGKIAAGSVRANELAADSVTAVKVSAGAITTDKLDAEAVTAAKIKAGTITASQIAVDAITSGKVAAGAIGTRELQAQAITAGKLAVSDVSNAFAGSEIYESSGWTRYAGGNFSTEERRNGKATSMRLSDGGVSAAFTFDGNFPVSEGDQYYIELWARRTASWDGTTSNSKLRVGNQSNNLVAAVSYAASDMAPNVWTKLSGEFTVPSGVNRLQFSLSRDNTLGYVYLSDLVIRQKNKGELIVDGAITANKISAGSVTTDALAASAIIASKIASGAVTAAKIDVANLSAISANMGTLTAGEIRLNFLAGDNGTGILLRGSDGYAELNNVKIRRQIEVASGTVTLGAIPSTGTFSLGSSTGDGANSDSNPNWVILSAVRYVRSTPVLLSAWGGGNKTYIATVDQIGGTVEYDSGDSGDVYSGWKADVLPLTVLPGTGSSSQRLRLRMELWTRKVRGITDCQIRYKIYEVS